MRVRSLYLAMVLVTLVCPRPTPAKTVFYSISIGNNTPPAGSRLPVLRYADDDAIRYHQTFSKFADRAALLTVPDLQTQRRYPQLSHLAPTRAELLRVVRSYRASMLNDRERGDASILFLAFSGHGDRLPSGEPFLALSDGPLTRRSLHDDVLAQLPATTIHLFVDSCYAEAVVGSRGRFSESSARTVSVSPAEASQALADATLSRFPNVGALLAASSDAEAHEWSRVESGVFTHEVLSGLAGAADVNGDGRVEYSELQAFLASANRDLKDPRARPDVVALPPREDVHAPLMSLAWLRNTRWVFGNPSNLGHFFIELENGQRYLDANLRPKGQVTFAIPASERVFLVAGDREAEIPPGPPGQAVALGELSLQPRSLAAKGSLDASYRSALFDAPFGPTYYLGYVDSAGLVGVDFSTTGASISVVAEAGNGSAKAAAVTLWIVGGASLVATGVFGGLALHDWSELNGTNLQKPAAEWNSALGKDRTVAAVCAGGALLGGVVGWLLWPKSPPPVQVSLQTEPRTASVAMSGAW